MLSVKASFPKSARSQSGVAPDSVRLSYSGLVFEISSGSVAESLDSNGNASPLALASIDRLPNGIRIKMNPGVVVTATSSQGASEHFSLAASAPDGVTAIRLHFTSSQARFSESNGARSLSFRNLPYALSLGSGTLDADTGTLTLHPGDTGLALTKLATPAIASTKTVPSGAPEQFVAQPPKDAATFGAEIAAWRDKAWSGLATTRFDPDKLTWKGADGTPAFSEKAIVAYIAEALARGSYADALSRTRNVKNKWPDKIGYLSAPYLGGLVPKMKAFESADTAEVKRVTQLVTDKSPTIFEKEGLLRFLLDHTPYANTQDALRFFADADPAKLSMRQDVGFLGCVIDAKTLLKDDDNPLRDRGGAVADRLVAAVRKTSSGYFLVTEDDGSTDLRISLVAGLDLIAYGSSVSKPMLVGVGQSLVEGVLGLADPQGFEPARLVAHGGTIDQRSGAIASEDIYALVSGNSYYPHEVSFARDIGPGLWAWTCSPSLVVQVGVSRYIFTARFPQGSSHYLVFYGIKPFDNIQLYGIDYSPDSDFEKYDASGYLYAKGTSALYMKMKHKNDNEDIKLSF
jgi:hypothetical protein